MPAPRLLTLPSVPNKKVFLLPAGLDPEQTLDWAPAYYKAKLGVDVEILPAIPIPDDVVDPKRHQVESGALLDQIQQRYAHLLVDPENVLVVATSRDLFIRSFNWSYTENYRANGQLAIVSCARLHPPGFLNRWNPEWARSRMQKMLTKNITILYFDLPMSSDYTSLLSGGVLSGSEVDLMSGSIVGAERQWDPFVESGDVETTIVAVPGKPPMWRLASSRDLIETSSHVFNADLTVGLFIYRKADFVSDGDYPLRLVRTYRNQDPQSRPFGLGANDSLDIFLAGQMGHYIDLVFEDGGRMRFLHVSGNGGGAYQGERSPSSPFSRARAFYSRNLWTVERADGWKFYFPYRPHAIGANVTVLTGFSDPSGHNYEMVRDDAGDLLSVTTPSGYVLRLNRDPEHRVHSITDSSGRLVEYGYDDAGRLVHVKDSEGNEETYTYDDRAEMISVTLGGGSPVVTNAYGVGGNILSQTLADGGRFEYHCSRDDQSRGNGILPDLITAPNGLLTFIQYQPGGYKRSLPTPQQQ